MTTTINDAFEDYLRNCYGEGDEALDPSHPKHKNLKAAFVAGGMSGAKLFAEAIRDAGVAAASHIHEAGRDLMKTM